MNKVSFVILHKLNIIKIISKSIKVEYKISMGMCLFFVKKRKENNYENLNFNRLNRVNRQTNNNFY